MASQTDPKRDPLKDASDPETTPFDYIVVGSGAGGGVLAARLARSGKRVLVLEAGSDVATDRQGCGPLDAKAHAEAKLRYVYEVPVYYGAASEDRDMSWSFSVRHYADTEEQAKDPKYNPEKDPAATPDPNWPKGKGGIFYPRVSGLGGCTNHHAMIIVKPNDVDWERIAALTGDPSWQPSAMQGYFAVIEQVLYYTVYRSAFRRALGKIAELWRAFLTFINPSEQLDNGGHGTAGWQKTSFISPLLILTIAIKDSVFIRVLLGAIWWILKKGGGLKAFIKSIFTLSVVQFLDPNYRRDWPAAPDVNLKFIPIGTDGKRRVGLREWLLKNVIDYPDNLTIVTCALATRIIFAPANEGAGDDDCRTAGGGERRPPVPRAIGVEVAEGPHLYQASPESKSDEDSHRRAVRYQLFARCEVILSGGTYNSPQLLMLSGIGDQKELAKHGIDGLRDRGGNKIAEGIDLAGVGQNLQDRYEVGVVAQTKKPFKTLAHDTLVPPPPGQLPQDYDPALKQWIEKGTGLYVTNGGAIAFLARSGHHHGDEPDLFVFGVPAAFRGYYWGWSSQLLYPEQVPPGEPIDQRNIWTWVILKAYTHNSGTVKLRSASPFAQLEIDTDYFARDPETGFYTPGAEQDLAAVEAGVELVRKINDSISLIDREVWPGKNVTNSGIAKWIHQISWGHHANGTCRMGSDPWRPYASELKDKGAVLDSRFCVHGVERLRVVDASIFPEIPGYFIVTPIFMAAEKAAETIIADSITYPDQLEAKEAHAVQQRRQAALVSPGWEERQERSGYPTGSATAAAPFSSVVTEEGGVSGYGAPTGAAGTPGSVDPTRRDDRRLPKDAVGLALSGGGIRSATYCLGALQALSAQGRLRGIDFLSTISGGGYIGSFLGRLFTRVAGDVADKPAYVERVLRDSNSAEIEWLRTHVNYLAGEGLSDLKTNLGTIWRNLIAVQLVVGTFFIFIFGLLRVLAVPLGNVPGIPATPVTFLGFQLSPWWWLPVVVALLFGLPIFFAYWLAPRKKGGPPYAVFALILWVVLLGGAVAALGIPGLKLLALVGLVILLLAWVWELLASLHMQKGTDTRTQGIILRGRLTYLAGGAVLVFVATTSWVVLDTLARATAGETMRPMIVGLAGIVMGILPFFRDTVANLTKPKTPAGAAAPSGGTPGLLIALIAFGLFGFLLFALDVLVHWSFDHSTAVGWWLIAVAFAVSVVLGRDVNFLNLSSLQTTYAARLARTFLGASNPQRIYPHGKTTPTEVSVPDADDDIEFEKYHPELKGGPLHLIGVCVNETADAASGRHLKSDKGMQMALGPEGISVGRRFTALWERTAASVLTGESVVRAIIPSNDPNAFHVLKKRGSDTAEVEPLRLSQWIATSGAAFSTGSGRNTKLSLSLLLGLLNVRLGYWWDSHIRAGQRPGCYPPGFWRRLLELPSFIFRTERMLLDEWRGYYGGPSQRYWYLSDGGHFEGTGLYELIRRRLPFMIAIDALQDSKYQFQDVSQLIRLAEIDFGAHCQWIDPAPARLEGKTGWAAFHPAHGPGVPIWIQEWLDPEAIGPWQEIKRNGPYAAALARVTYTKGWKREPSWLLLLKAAVPPGVPLEVRCYAEVNPKFPNDPTADQFLTDEQWESYRELGECMMGRVVRVKAGT